MTDRRGIAALAAGNRNNNATGSMGRNNCNSFGTNEILSDSLDEELLVCVRDCGCKTPLLDALKRTQVALAMSKSAIEDEKTENVKMLRENKGLKSQVDDLVEKMEISDGEKIELQSQIEILKASLQQSEYAQKNAILLQDRLKSELVKVHGEAAHEAQLKNKLYTEVESLKEQNEELAKQIREYDDYRMSADLDRMEEHKKRLEAENALKMMESKGCREREEDQGIIEALQQRTKMLSNQKVTAEKESRSMQEKLEVALEAVKTFEKQVETMVETHSAEVNNLKYEIEKLADSNQRFQKDIEGCRENSNREICELEDAKKQTNTLLLRATKEIAHLDRTTEDLEIATRAMQEEVKRLKEEKAQLAKSMTLKEEELEMKRADWRFELGALKKTNAELEEQLNDERVKAVGLESQLSSANRLLELKEVDLQEQQEAMERRRESIDSAVKDTTERLHEEISFLQNALRGKVEELQNLKSAIAAAGGNISLMPINDWDAKRMAEEIKQLSERNSILKENAEEAARDIDALKSEIRDLLLEKESMLQEMDLKTKEWENEIELKATSLASLQEQLDDLSERLHHEEEEKNKLANILLKQLEPSPVDAPEVDRSPKVSRPVEYVPRGKSLSNKDSEEETLSDLRDKVMQAKQFVFKKGVHESILREGIQLQGLEQVAKTYDDTHLDFDQRLSDLMAKAEGYREENLDIGTKIKELKLDNHFLENEMQVYKMVERRLIVDGLIDKDTLKNLKIDTAEELAKSGPPPDLDEDISKIIPAKEYAKKSLERMSNVFADQKHILDAAEQFFTVDDLLDALRQDINVETQTLKREIEDLIKIVDGLKNGPESEEPRKSSDDTNKKKPSEVVDETVEEQINDEDESRGKNDDDDRRKLNVNKMGNENRTSDEMRRNINLNRESAVPKLPSIHTNKLSQREKSKSADDGRFIRASLSPKFSETERQKKVKSESADWHRVKQFAAKSARARNFQVEDDDDDSFIYASQQNQVRSAPSNSSEFLWSQDRSGNFFRVDDNFNRFVYDPRGFEWLVDEGGRGWRDNASGQRIMIDPVGREWKMRDEEIGYRRDGTGQKWVIEASTGCVWLVDSKERRWKVDKDGNLRMRDVRGRELMVDGEDRQWMVDEKRPTRLEERVSVPGEVTKLLQQTFNNNSPTDGESPPLVNARIRRVSKEPTPVTTSVTESDDDDDDWSQWTARSFDSKGRKSCAKWSTSAKRGSDVEESRFRDEDTSEACSGRSGGSKGSRRRRRSQLVERDRSNRRAKPTKIYFKREIEFDEIPLEDSSTIENSSSDSAFERNLRIKDSPLYYYNNTCGV